MCILMLPFVLFVTNKCGIKKNDDVHDSELRYKRQTYHGNIYMYILTNVKENS